jgi:hypothetical protein
VRRIRLAFRNAANQEESRIQIVETALKHGAKKRIRFFANTMRQHNDSARSDPAEPPAL